MNPNIEIVILVGANHIVITVPRARAREVSDDLLTATRSHGVFQTEHAVALGAAITGWYCREIQPTAQDRIATILEKTEGDGEKWKQ